MDGVLADFDQCVFDAALGVDFPEAALRREARFCTDFLSKRGRARVRTYIESGHFFRGLPLVPGALEGVAGLEAAGHDLWVCSKPLEANPHCASDKMGWIEEHFPSLVGKVILAPKKSMIKGDVLLDDAHKVRDFHEASWVPVWYPYPHNFNVDRAYWSWGDPVEDLVRYAEAWSFYKEELYS